VGVASATLAVLTTAALHRHGDRVRHGAVHAAAVALERELHRHAPLRRFLRDRVRVAELTGLLLTLALLALVAVGTAAFQVRTDSAVVRTDRIVAEWAADHAVASSTEFLRWFTDLGSTVGVIVILVLVVAIGARRIPWRRAALFAVVTVGGVNLLTNLLKVVVERDRPDLGPLAAPSSFSYPSGHSSSAAACVAVAAVCLGRGRSRRARTALVAGAAALATMIATSRVLLGVHWLSDVVAGLALGAAWFALCAIAFGGRLIRFGAPVEMAARVEVLDHPPGEWLRTGPRRASEGDDGDGGRDEQPSA